MAERLAFSRDLDNLTLASPRLNRHHKRAKDAVEWMPARNRCWFARQVIIAGRADGTWTRADFEWDAENDQYICPEGQELKQFRRNYSDPNKGPTGKGTAKYRALKPICQSCPSKAKCCPNMDARSITREEHEDARQVARDIAKTKQYHISMKLRKKVEMLFAHLKRILGLGRLRLRGPEHCEAQSEQFEQCVDLAQLRRQKFADSQPVPSQGVG